MFDTALADFNYPQLFTENRFTGGDRFGDANQLTARADLALPAGERAGGAARHARPALLFPRRARRAHARLAAAHRERHRTSSRRSAAACSALRPST